MKAVKKLRTPNLVSELVKSKLKRSILDCETRWNSTYNMLQRLLELKHFCQMNADQFKQLDLSNSEWNSIESLVIFKYC